jgi:N-acetyl sugar amidotransferase
MKNKIYWCKSCLNMSTRPRIQFDENQICNACSWSNKKKKLNWNIRKKELLKLLKKYKSKNDSFDCIVPVSGGKDGSYVAYKLKHEFGMRPLTITSRPPLTLPVGNQNLENFVRSGYDHIHVTPNEEVMRIFNKKGLIDMGFPYYGWLVSIYSVVIKMSLSLKIPLIFYGENGEVEYGGNLTKNTPRVSLKEISKIFLEGGYQKILNKLKKEKKSLAWFELPKIKEKDFFITHWSYFEAWDSYRNYLVAKKHCNLTESESTNPGTFTNFAQTDQALYDLHTYLMYLKFGFGRATQDVGIEIRRGAMTRDQGVNLVKLYDGQFPNHHLKTYLNYYKMTNKELNKVFDKWVNKNLFYKCKKEKIWKPKFEVDTEFEY